MRKDQSFNGESLLSMDCEEAAGFFETSVWLGFPGFELFWRSFKLNLILPQSNGPIQRIPCAARCEISKLTPWPLGAPASFCSTTSAGLIEAFADALQQ